MQFCATGKRIPTAVLTCTKADGEDADKFIKYYTVTLTNVLISNYTIAGSDDLQESFALHFQQYEVVPFSQDNKGLAVAGASQKFNIQTNSATNLVKA